MRAKLLRHWPRLTGNRRYLFLREQTTYRRRDLSFEKVPSFLLDLFKAEMNGNGTPAYRFDSFLLDVAERQLCHNEIPVPLTPKAFDVLVHLVEHSGHLVLKDELMQAVWPDSFVDEVNLPRTIHTLRKALGEDHNGNKFIETVPTKGYRFVAPLTEARESNSENSTNGNHSSAERVEQLFTTGPQISPIAKDKTTILRRTAHIMLIGGGFLIAVFLVFIFAFNYSSVSSGESNEVKTIAVLPLKPLTAEDSDSNYELGIADSLIFRLSSAKGIVVRSLSATRKYADNDEDPIAAGREQKVDYVLASNYQIADGKIRVTSQLVNVQSGVVEDTFKVEQINSTIFSIQDAVAANIGQSLLKKLNREPNNLVAKRYTVNEEAYRLYWQGTVLADKRTPKDLHKATEYFEKAIELDPNYALAYAGLANAHNGIAIQSGDTHTEYLKAKAAVEKALAIDDNLAEAHSYVGEMKLIYEWDFAGAENEIKKGIELDPNSPHVHRVYSVFLNAMARFDESFAEIKTAIDLEPTSVLNHKIYTMNLYFARRYDEAIAEGQRTVEMDPDLGMAYGWLMRSYQMKGDVNNAFEWFLRSPGIRLKNPEKIPLWKEIYARSGWHGILQQRIKDTREQLNGYDKAWELSALYNELGDEEQAMAYLEKASRFNERSWDWIGLTIDPRNDLLRSDPRFDDLLKRIGLK